MIHASNNDWMIDLPDELPLKRNYGSGVYRRRIVVKRLSPTITAAAMEDDQHALQLKLTHDSASIANISANWERHPFTGCAGASKALERLSGESIHSDIGELYKSANIREHCTHMFDVLAVAITQSTRNQIKRVYDVVIPDAVNNRQGAKVFCDGRLVIDWVVENLVIVEPEQFRGVGVLNGLTRWASDHLSPELREYVLVAQRGYFVSMGNRYETNQLLGTSQTTHGPPEGSCYASQPSRIASSFRVGEGRDFTSGTHSILQFIDDSIFGD